MGIEFDIIIPTRNEAADIVPTLEHAAAQTVAVREIIVVDDSDDETPDLVRAAARTMPNLRLLSGNRTGRCGARNMGVLASRADVVVLLNADVRLPANFIERLIPHYEAGAACVLVASRPANESAVRARFIAAQAAAAYRDDGSLHWTEGFSCRRDLALKAGLFPVTPLPLFAGEDGFFAARVCEAGRKVVDRGIVVDFVAPVSTPGFFRTYKERAYPHAHYFLHSRSLLHILFRTLGKQILRLARAATVIPLLISCLRLCRESPRGRRDMLPFVAADLFQSLAVTAGEWEGFYLLISGLAEKRRTAK